MQNSQPKSETFWKVVGLVIPIFVSGLAGYSSFMVDSVRREHDDLTKRVVALEGLVSGLMQSVARTLQHVELHTEEKNHWIARIEENSKLLHSLAKDSAARPDPFTGTEGRQLERRIDALEQIAELVKWLKSQVEEMRKDMRETEGYYRRQVLPLIEQSNSLQMQSQQHGIKSN